MNIYLSLLLFIKIRESGVTLWALEEFKRARSLWEQALTFSGYDFEYRLAIVSYYIDNV